MAINNDMTEETRDGLAMAGPIMQFEPPGHQVIKTETGFKEVETPGWIKFGIAFRNILGQLKGARLSVFMAICLHVNEKGEAWPSLDTLVAETGYQRAAVVEAIKHLSDMGLVDIDRASHRSNTYRPMYAAYGSESEIKLPNQLNNKAVRKSNSAVRFSNPSVRLPNSVGTKSEPEVEPLSRTKEEDAPMAHPIPVSLDDWLGRPEKPDTKVTTNVLVSGFENNQKLTNALETLTGRRIDPKNKTAAGYIADLREQGADPPKCSHFGHYWDVTQKWRGESSRPTLREVWELWGTVMAWKSPTAARQSNPLRRVYT
jgi:biotin operon repressor